MPADGATPTSEAASAPGCLARPPAADAERHAHARELDDAEGHEDTDAAGHVERAPHHDAQRNEGEQRHGRPAPHTRPVGSGQPLHRATDHEAGGDGTDQGAPGVRRMTLDEQHHRRRREQDAEPGDAFGRDGHGTRHPAPRGVDALSPGPPRVAGYATREHGVQRARPVALDQGTSSSQRMARPEHDDAPACGLRRDRRSSEDQCGHDRPRGEDVECGPEGSCPEARYQHAEEHDGDQQPDDRQQPRAPRRSTRENGLVACARAVPRALATVSKSPRRPPASVPSPRG